MEVTSEDPSFPIESAFGSNAGPGWRASQGGEQQIRVIFDNPCRCIAWSFISMSGVRANAGVHPSLVVGLGGGGDRNRAPTMDLQSIRLHDGN